MVKVSVIVPSYKRIEQTIKTLDLIKSSKLSENIDLEVVVADCTPDDSLKNAINERFEDEIHYTRPQKDGIATNKNQGAKVANGNILIFCDSDIEVEEESIQKTVDYLKSNRFAGAVGTQVMWRGGEKDGQFDRPRPEDRRHKHDGFKAVEAIYSRYIATYKDVFELVGGYDEEVFNMRGEGSDLSLKYWRAGFPLFFETNVNVYHIHDAPDSIALRIANPEWAIAKDLFLLLYKYDMLDEDYPNFINTVNANFSKFGDGSGAEIMKGIANNYEMIASVKDAIDKEKENMNVEYDFKFLEVFSNEELLSKCLVNSEERLKSVRERVFSDG